MEDWKSYAVEEYFAKERSFHSIGKELGKNPKTVRDAILRAGLTPRSKSHAQKLVIERNGPPMTRPRTEKEKRSISKGHERRLASMSPSELKKYKDKLSKRAKKQWAKLSDKDKETLLQPMRDGSRLTAGRGSKAENRIGQLLEEDGLFVERRSKRYTAPYEIDILLLKESIAIECDGPTHFLPIYGEMALDRSKARDRIKDSFLTALGINVVRIRDHTKSYSMSACRGAYEKVVEILQKVRSEKSSPKVWIVDMT
jgi:very-short-patch-repair endonuclease